MSVKVEIPYHKALNVPLAPRAAYDWFANVEKAVPNNFPGIEVFEKVGAETYRWQFEKLSYGGHNLAIELVTRFSFEPGVSVLMTPVPEPGKSQLEGGWRFELSGSGTKVSLDFKLELELPLPFFLKKMAEPIAHKEITKLFERYASHVEKHLKA